jgi:hypothetical protein
MVRRDEGYAFRFARSRLSLAIAATGALGAASVGTVLLLAGASHLGPRSPAGAALLALGVALVLAAVVVLRRATVQCHDCRIGEAGVYVATLREARFLGWGEVARLEVEGRIVRIVYRAGRRLAECWVEAPRGAAAELARIAIFARGRVRPAAELGVPG